MGSKDSRPKAQAPRKLSFWTFCTANGEDILVSMRLLLAAVIGLFLDGVARALAAAFGAIDRQVGSTGQGQRARRDTARVTLLGLSHVAQGAPQDGQQAMNPVVGLRLTQRELQPVHDLQGVGLLID